jgi:hypothetical protein
MGALTQLKIIRILRLTKLLRLAKMAQILEALEFNFPALAVRRIITQHEHVSMRAFEPEWG